MIRTPVFPNVPVLILDESAFVRRTIRGMLEQAGMRRIAEAGDVQEAVKHLTRLKPGLIIVDWQPKAAVLVSMLRDPERSTQTSVPVIAISAAPTARMVDAAAQQNVESLLRKPFAPKLLWERIGRYFTLDVGAGTRSVDGTDDDLIRPIGPPPAQASIGGPPAGEVEDGAGGKTIFL